MRGVSHRLWMRLIFDHDRGFVDQAHASGDDYAMVRPGLVVRSINLRT